MASGLSKVVDSAKKESWFIMAVVSMVAGMIRELSTLQNLLCGQERKQYWFAKTDKFSFMIYHLLYFRSICFKVGWFANPITNFECTLYMFSNLGMPRYR